MCVCCFFCVWPGSNRRRRLRQLSLPCCLHALSGCMWIQSLGFLLLQLTRILHTCVYTGSLQAGRISVFSHDLANIQGSAQAQPLGCSCSELPHLRPRAGSMYSVLVAAMTLVLPMPTTGVARCIGAVSLFGFPFLLIQACCMPVCLRVCVYMCMYRCMCIRVWCCLY